MAWIDLTGWFGQNFEWYMSSLYCVCVRVHVCVFECMHASITASIMSSMCAFFVCTCEHFCTNFIHYDF